VSIAIDRSQSSKVGRGLAVMKQPGDFFGTVQNFLKERPILLPDGASIFTPLSIEQSQLQACAS
jgi:hypothetical protein